VNILIIDNSNAFTGAFKCALNEASLLADVHHFVFVVPVKSKNTALIQKKGFTVYELPLHELSKSFKSISQYPFYLLGNMARLRKIVAREKIETVQVNDFYNLLGAGLKRIDKKLKLITYVRFLPSSLPATLRKMWTNAAQKNSDYVIAVSDAVLQQLPPQSNTIRIYDAVMPEENEEIKENEDGICRFLFLANFTRGKGQEYALEAFINACQKNKKIRLHYVGGDLELEKNRNFRRELEQAVKQAGLSDVVTFNGFSSDTERLIKTHEVLLNFSDAESFSMTCLEASFYGKPVIATRCGGPEEIIVNEVSGLLVDKKDIRGMEDAMLQFATDANKRRAYGMSGRKIVREKFSAEGFRKKFSGILNTLS